MEYVRNQNFEKPVVFFYGEVPLRVDFLTKVNLINFNDAWKKRRLWTVEDIQIPIVDYEDLILTKITTGRTKDKLDIEELQKINQKKKAN